MDMEYVHAELSQATVPEGAVDDRVKVKAIGPMGESKWVTVSPEKYREIVALFES